MYADLFVWTRIHLSRQRINLLLCTLHNSETAAFCPSANKADCTALLPHLLFSVHKCIQGFSASIKCSYINVSAFFSLNIIVLKNQSFA